MEVIGGYGTEMGVSGQREGEGGLTLGEQQGERYSHVDTILVYLSLNGR